MVEPDDLLSNEDSYGFDEKFARVYVRYQNDLKFNMQVKSIVANLMQNLDKH